jgi:hypothetical protein
MDRRNAEHIAIEAVDFMAPSFAKVTLGFFGLLLGVTAGFTAGLGMWSFITIPTGVCEFSSKDPGACWISLFIAIVASVTLFTVASTFLAWALGHHFERR